MKKAMAAAMLTGTETVTAMGTVTAMMATTLATRTTHTLTVSGTLGLTRVQAAMPMMIPPTHHQGSTMAAMSPRPRSPP